MRSITIKITSCLVCILFLTFWPREAQAFWNRSFSIEWWVNVSEAIVVVDITGRRDIESDYPTRKIHELTGNVRETLLGKNPNTVIFRQDYSLDLPSEAMLSDRGIAVGDRVLIFLATNTSSHKRETAFWINLTSPGTKFQAHAAYNNEAKYLSDSMSILALVKARIKQGETTKRRGLIVMFPHAAEGIWWDFVITAEARYKQKLIQQLRKNDVPASAIYNLVSYPDPETVRLIRPFLKDNTKEEAQIGPPSKTITYYPVRQTAYLALIRLGEKVKPPEPYYPNLPVDIGFENSAYFEYGPHPPRKW